MQRALMTLLAIATLAHAGGAQQPLTLADAVDRALASYPSLAVAHAHRDRAFAEAGEARAARRPRLALDASFTQFQEPMVVQPLHGLDFTQPPLFDRSLVQAGLSASWTVYDFGQRASIVTVRDALVDAADASVATTEAQVVARTINAFVRVLTARDVLAAQDQRIAALDAQAARIAQLLAEGKAAPIEQLRITAESRRAAADRIATASALTVAEQDLAQLTGLAIGSIRGVSMAGPQTSVSATDTALAGRAAAVDRAARASPQVRELGARVRAMDAQLTGARSVLFPELRALGGYIDRGRASGDFVAEWQLGLAVTWPLYTGGSRTHLIDRADAEHRAAAAQLSLARLEIANGVDRALAALRDADARTTALQSAVEQFAEVVRIERLALEVGSGTQTTYIDAEANLLRARASLIEAQHSAFLARVELARLTGDLSRDWAARAGDTQLNDQ